MRAFLHLSVAIVIGLLHSGVYAAGQAPDSDACKSADAQSDNITRGGCLAIDRKKGNCQACHFVAGIPSGNIAPPLVGIAERYKDQTRLRAQIENPAQFNPDTVMPLYGKFGVLTKDEIEKLTEWLLTL